MRLLILALTLSLSPLLLIQSVDALADTAIHTDQQASAIRAKSKNTRLPPVKHKSVKNPGDVWERIRATMQIPRPGPVPTLPDINNGLPNAAPDTGTSAEKILRSQKIRLPVTASAPMYNYTPYGRLKLNAAIASRVRRPIALTKPSPVANNATVATDTRLHTRIEPRPTLDLSLPDPFASRPFFPTPTVTTERLAAPVITAAVSPPPSPTVLTPHHAKAAIKYDRVHKHIVWYTEHSSYLHQVAERAHPYLYHIVENLHQHQLPSELALLPIVESAYQPTALSPKSAAGLWQFMPSTGQDFDLYQNDHYDARLDIAASTQAAVRYLTFLKQHFDGDWLLALAAYNCGLGTVDDAIERNIAEGLDTDYWSLRLPEETQEYVPRFLALSSIFADPEAHGLKFAPVRNEPYFVKVKIDRKHDIAYLAKKEFKEVAQLADLSYEQFSRLNPGYLNPTLAADGPYTFLMPMANANQFHQRLTSIAQFLNKSTAMTTSPAPLIKSPLPAIDEQKTALSALVDPLPNSADLVSTPFVSINLDTRQTTPRLINQPAPLSTEPKRVKNTL